MSTSSSFTRLVAVAFHRDILMDTKCQLFVHSSESTFSLKENEQNSLFQFSLHSDKFESDPHFLIGMEEEMRKKLIPNERDLIGKAKDMKFSLNEEEITVGKFCKQI